MVILSGCFIGAWFNRYAPPVAGGEVVLMKMAGRYLPYRDYFTQVPPGMPMLIQGIAAVAGPHLIATLAFGALLRIAAAAALYGLLLTVCRPSFAVLGTIAALMLSSTDMSDTPFYYNHVGAALVVIGTWFGFAAARGARWWHLLAAAGCGALLTFAVAVKQTMVFGSAGSLLALVVLALPRPTRGWTTWLFTMAAGGIAVVGSIWRWMVAHVLVQSFVFAMTQAPQAKGGVGRSFLRPVFQLPTLFVEGIATALAWALIVSVALLLIRFRRNERARMDPIVILMALGAWGLIAVFMFGKFVTMFLTAVGWWGSLAVAVIALMEARRRGADPVVRGRIALGILSFSIGYCFAVSWPLFENLAFPGFALVIVVLLEFAPVSTSRQWVTAIVILAVGAMAFSMYRKVEAPYGWGPWLEPPLYSVRGDLKDPIFAGMRLSKPESDLYALTRQIASANTRPGEPIYVYPNLTILYAVADRPAATYALAHWVDTCPDFLGLQDAETLRARPPKLMIVRRDELALVEYQEQIYRAGVRSSVRDVLDAMEELSPRYDRVAVFKNAADAPIEFLVRRD